jgi:hypothetical protein
MYNIQDLGIVLDMCQCTKEKGRERLVFGKVRKFCVTPVGAKLMVSQKKNNAMAGICHRRARRVGNPSIAEIRKVSILGFGQGG